MVIINIKHYDENKQDTEKKYGQEKREWGLSLKNEMEPTMRKLEAKTQSTILSSK